MPIASLASFASLRGRSALVCFALLAGIGFASAAAASPNVTEVVLRFRDAPIAAEPAAAPSAAEFGVIGRTLRTGVAHWKPTLDGGFRITLAPSMPFEAARDAVNRLRMDESVLYASIAATDAPTPASTLSDRKGGAAEPPLQRLIVRYRDSKLAADAAADRPLAATQLDAIAAIAGQPVAHERAIAWTNAQIVRLFSPLPREQAEALAQRIAQQPDVLWAQPDYVYRIAFTPNDPLYNMPPSNVQWHYFEAVGGVNLPAAWDKTRGWSGIRTAVGDTGALFGHPDLTGRWIGGYDFIVSFGSVDSNDGNNRDPDASDPGDWITANQCGFPHPPQNSSWHGTHVSGTIGATSNNGIGVAGVNHFSRIVPVRMLGMCGGFSSDIADGLFWASGGAVSGVPANPHPAKVINLSLGGFSPGQTCGNLEQIAINGATTNGTTVVISAGNDNVDASFSSPGNCAGVITVASIGRSGQRAGYSNHDVNDGSPIQVEIAAPGGAMSDGQLGVLSTLNMGTTTPTTHNYVQYQGTSMAAPHVTGVVSLLYSLKPTLTPGQALSTITSTARAFPTGTPQNRDCTSSIGSAIGTTRYCGAGIIDADAALTQLLNTGGPGGTPLTLATASLASSLNPSNSGQSVTFTATVTGTLPSGTVKFSDGDTTLASCGAVALTGAGNSRTAQCTTSALTPGLHPILASYSGSTTNTPVDSNVVFQQVNVVGSQTTTTALSSSLNPSTPGASVTFTATVTGQTTAPTGNVGFTADGVTISGCATRPLTPGGGTQSTATCTTTGLAAGQRTIVASYAGTASHLASVSPDFIQSVTMANACAGFNDVLNTSSFCDNLQWLVNRVITGGCAVGAYCPNNSVIRLAMAAFQNREGLALTPIDLPVAEEDTAPNLSTAQALCITGSYAVTGFPRRAFLRGRANPYSASTTSDYSIEHVFSTNGGATWQAVPGSMVFQSLTGGLTPPDDKTVTLYGVVDLNVGSTYVFAQRVARTGGTANPGYYCAQFVQIGNRNGAAPPF